MTGVGNPDPLRIDFHLLDRQIVDADAEPVGKVDDVELTLDQATGRLQVTALLSGQQVLGERLGGRLGQLMAGVARRLDPVENRPPMRIPMRQVADIGSAITLTINPEAHPTPPLEQWLTDHVITKIPGADDAS
jgi:sporulation protein YlmC with PRC-barrel domain